MVMVRSRITLATYGARSFTSDKFNLFLMTLSLFQIRSGACLRWFVIRVWLLSRFTFLLLQLLLLLIVIIILLISLSLLSHFSINSFHLFWRIDLLLCCSCCLCCHLCGSCVHDACDIQLVFHRCRID